MIGAAHMYDLLKAQNLSDEKFIQVLPNSGYQEIVRGHSAYSEGASYYAEKMQKIAELGVNILGGCCGTTPTYIRNLSEMIAEHEPWEKLHVAEKVQKMLFPGHAIIRLWKNYSVVRKSLR